MDLKECYEKMGGDYNGFLNRLSNSEALAKKFALKFKDDKSYQSLLDGLKNQDWESAFRGAHTLKGVAANLGMSSLYDISSSICEDLRGNRPFNNQEKLNKLKEVYDVCIEALNHLD